MAMLTNAKSNSYFTILELQHFTIALNRPCWILCYQTCKSQCLETTNLNLNFKLDWEFFLVHLSSLKSMQPHINTTTHVRNMVTIYGVSSFFFPENIYSVFIFRQNATVQKNHFPITTIVLCTDLVILAMIRLLFTVWS